MGSRVCCLNRAIGAPPYCVCDDSSGCVADVDTAGKVSCIQTDCPDCSNGCRCLLFRVNENTPEVDPFYPESELNTPGYRGPVRLACSRLMTHRNPR